MKSETIGKLAEALSKAQQEMASAKKNAENPFLKNKYADLAAVTDAIKDPLAKNGLSYVQYSESDEHDKNYIVTTLMHSSGEWISGRMKLFIQKQDMQGFGGAITYARRYALSAMVGLPQEDDDGETALGREVKKKAAGETRPPQATYQGPVHISGDIRNEVEEIRAYQKELQISEEIFKKRLKELYDTDTMKGLSIDRLRDFKKRLKAEAQV